MPSAVESTTTTASLDAGGMRSSTERGDDDDDEQVAQQRQPLQRTYIPLVGEQHHSARRDVGRRAHRLLGHLETSVDARTAFAKSRSQNWFF